MVRVKKSDEVVVRETATNAIAGDLRERAGEARVEAERHVEQKQDRQRQQDWENNMADGTQRRLAMLQRLEEQKGARHDDDSGLEMGEHACGEEECGQIGKRGRCAWSLHIV